MNKQQIKEHKVAFNIPEKAKLKGICIVDESGQKVLSSIEGDRKSLESFIFKEEPKTALLFKDISFAAKWVEIANRPWMIAAIYEFKKPGVKDSLIYVAGITKYKGATA